MHFADGKFWEILGIAPAATRGELAHFTSTARASRVSRQAGEPNLSPPESYRRRPEKSAEIRGEHRWVKFDPGAFDVHMHTK
jgi:hypothetical protein